MSIGFGDYWMCIHRDRARSTPMLLEDFGSFKVIDGAEYQRASARRTPV